MNYTARTNQNLKIFLEWLRGKTSILLPERKRKRLRTMNVAVTERMFFELSGYRERIFITGDQQFPVVKIVGLPNELNEIGDDSIDEVVTTLKIGIEDCKEEGND